MYGDKKQTGKSVKPPIVFSRDCVDNGQTMTDIYYSLGFKQVSYESEYGKNYSQRQWPWEDVDQNPPVLTAQQYQQLMAQLEARNKQKPVYNAYFKSFQTFDATILDVAKEGNKYTVYLKGAAYDFIEYNGAVYSNVDGDPNTEDYWEMAQQPILEKIWLRGPICILILKLKKQSCTVLCRTYGSLTAKLVHRIMTN